MRLISFDVGIKNLAYCVFSIQPILPTKLLCHFSDASHLYSNTSDPTPIKCSFQWSISEWNCVNLIAEDNPKPNDRVCNHLIKGSRKSDADRPCNKPAKWAVPTSDGSLSANAYCNLHAKIHDEWILPTKRHTPSYINKLKLVELEKEYSALKIDDQPSKKMKKMELVERITKYYESKCYLSTTESNIKTKTAGETDLVTIGRAIRRQLDGDPSIEGTTHVIIENQISTIASRMKTIQGMIAQYFIMRFGDKVHIEFVSSHNKLKGFSETTTTTTCLDKDKDKDVVTDSHDPQLQPPQLQPPQLEPPQLEPPQLEPPQLQPPQLEPPQLQPPTNKTKSTYKANKSDGINICRLFFESNPDEMGKWLSIFEKSKKRDDLADCFLQGVWYLKSNKIIYYAARLKHKYCVCIINNGDN